MTTLLPFHLAELHLSWPIAPFSGQGCLWKSSQSEIKVSKTVIELVRHHWRQLKCDLRRCSVLFGEKSNLDSPEASASILVEAKKLGRPPSEDSEEETLVLMQLDDNVPDLLSAWAPSHQESNGPVEAVVVWIKSYPQQVEAFPYRGHTRP